MSLARRFAKQNDILVLLEESFHPPRPWRLTFSQTAVASCRYRTDVPLLRQRAMERAQFILPILNYTRLCSERAPVWRLLADAATDYFPFRLHSLNSAQRRRTFRNQAAFVLTCAACPFQRRSLNLFHISMAKCAAGLRAVFSFGRCGGS